ncbi:hypothetical protein ACE1CI_09390 [Aerosakkonemataceae cyanobacterium BLCC-F50]|uniref:Uncharacterized protein n=1 Tax=Floridaenema flaviceps BLCC-F50 TaxID=3153642 RepID=A0ABV4XN31_9CYAN
MFNSSAKIALIVWEISGYLEDNSGNSVNDKKPISQLVKAIALL